MDILNQIRELTFKSAFQKGLLIGEKIDEIELPSDITHQLARKIILDFEQLGPITTINEVTGNLLRGFTYMFDKGVELAYFSRRFKEAEVEYNFEDLMNGISGDTFPIYIQEQVNPMIPVLADIYLSAIKFIEFKEKELSKSKIETKELMNLMLVGGAFLGVEFCLRLELQEES